MSRQRQSQGVVSEPQARPEEPQGKPAEGAPPVGLHLGWKIAIAVWLAGFVGLLLYEFFNLAWKLVMR